MRKLFLLFSLLAWSVSLHAFDVRGFHIDLRTQVMTMDALKQTAKKAADGGLNTIIMEWEATFPFEENAVLCKKGAYTREEVKDFVSYCTGLGLDVIPLQNCFGHADYILMHQRYAGIREDGWNYSQVCPSKLKECHKVFESIFREVVALHPSKYIHIGADETRLLGNCKVCSKKTKSDLFVDYVNEMCSIVKEMGKTPIIWSDMLLKHPEAAGRLSKDIIILDWNYGWANDRFGDIDGLLKLGFTVWGAPALRSGPDNIMITCWEKHFRNLGTYVDYCREKGFKGLIETSWSTSGQYGWIYDSGTNGTEALDLDAIRQVYPLSAFDALQTAFCEAACSDRHFDHVAFVKRYAAQRFGLNSEGVKVIEDFFYMPQADRQSKSATFYQDEIGKVMDVRNRLAALKVKSNKTDIDHFILSLDIRAHYLRFKAVDSRYESPAYRPSDNAVIASELKQLIKEAESLRKRVEKLNGKYLKDCSEILGEFSYVRKIKLIYDRIK